MNDETRVVQFPGTEQLPENPVQVDRAAFSYCNHPSIRIDEHNREIHCTKCNAALEAFAYLLRNGQNLQVAWSRYAEVKAQVSELAERVHQLKAEEQRIKARLKRLREKDQTVVEVRPDPRRAL